MNPFRHILFCLLLIPRIASPATTIIPPECAEGWGGVALEDEPSVAAVKPVVRGGRPTHVPKPDPGPPIEDLSKPADQRTYERVLRLLDQEGYAILNPNFALGSEGHLVQVLAPDGQQKLIKIGRRSPEALPAEVDLATQVRNALAAIGLGHAVPTTTELRLKGAPELSLLLTEMVPRKPGSFDPAPTLAQRMKDNFQGLPANARISILNQLAQIISAAHGKEIIHRDLKPENILVDDAGRVYVIDWGIAAKKDSYPAGAQPNSTSGTLAYMDAAQLAGKPAAPSNDINALRLLNWEILGAGQDLSTHTFDRPSWIGVRDFKHAPELEGVPRPLAVAVWNRSAKTVAEYEEGIRNAQSMTEAEFFKWYGGKLKSVDDAVPPLAGITKFAPNAAFSILESKSLIAQFPEGLGFDEVKTQEVIRAVDMLKVDVRGPIQLTGPHPFLYFAEFDARVRELKTRPKE